MSKKGGARASAGTASGGRYEVYLGMEAKKADLEDVRRSLNLAQIPQRDNYL